MTVQPPKRHPHAPTPLDLQWMAEIAYPFGVMYSVHRGPTDPVHGDASALAHTRVVHRTNHVLPCVAQSASQSTRSQSHRRFAEKPSRFPVINPQSNKFKIISFRPCFYSFRTLCFPEIVCPVQNTFKFRILIVLIQK